MFFPEGHIRVFVYGYPVSMRLSHDGLYALVRHHMERDPLSGDLYGFINRRANQIKILYFDRSGWCLWPKRLERGRLVTDWSGVRTREMDWTGLKLLQAPRGAGRRAGRAGHGLRRRARHASAAREDRGRRPRARTRRQPAANADETNLFFDERKVPVEVIAVPNPETEGLAPDQYEVIGEKVTHRLAQRPGSHVVLKYVRPVIKRRDTQVLSCPPAPCA